MVMTNTNAIREQVIRLIAGSHTSSKIGQVMYRLGPFKIHAKVKSGNLVKYPFNINDTVLSADYEVLICGSHELYYVLPIQVVRTMHDDLKAMPDKRNPGYTIYDVVPSSNQVVYGTGGKSMNVSKYRCLQLRSDGKFA